MRRVLLGLVVVAAASLQATPARAQAPFGSFNDPFFLYYGYYLPQQQLRSLQAGPEATINAITAERQRFATTNRGALYGIGDTPGGDETDALFERKGMSQKQLPAAGITNQALGGYGASGYFLRTGRYYPSVRVGKGRNSNIANVRGGRFGGGGGFGGMGFPGVGLPGPR